jgi:hypothetical protein
MGVRRTSAIERAEARTALMEKRCAQWNARHPVGAQVEYHSVIGEAEFKVFRTRTPAQVLSGLTAVVWLEGKSGCVCLEACVPVSVLRLSSQQGTPGGVPPQAEKEQTP